MFAAQCNVYGVEASSFSSTVERISWNCRDTDLTSEFTIMFKLNIKDQCNAPDELLSQQQSMDCMTCNRTLLDNGDYSYYLDLYGLHPYSTYAYSVQARAALDGTPVGGDQFTTDTAGECHAANVITMQNLINTKFRCSKVFQFRKTSGFQSHAHILEHVANACSLYAFANEEMS